MSRGSRGHTIAELVVVMAILGVFGPTIAEVLRGVLTTARVADAYVQDVQGLRRAVVAIETDARSGASLSDLGYRLENATLFRRGLPLCRNVDAFAFHEGATTTEVSLRLRSRSTRGVRREPGIALTVRRRTERQP